MTGNQAIAKILKAGGARLVRLFSKPFVDRCGCQRGVETDHLSPRAGGREHG